VAGIEPRAPGLS